MRLKRKIVDWVETWLRARRYATAQRPGYPVPAWIAAAESFSLMDANPMAPIAAATVGMLEQAGASSRLLLRYALELQAAADSLDSTRSQLTISDSFVNSPEGAAFETRRGRMALAEQSLLSALERQRRALADEREALCLLAGSMRRRLGRQDGGDDLGGAALDAPHPLLHGATLLSYFVSIRRLDVVEALLAMGCCPDAPNHDGSTALSIASRKAEALAGARGAGASNAACILSLLEAKSLSNEPATFASKPAGRI